MFKLFTNHKYADEAGQILRMFYPGEKVELVQDEACGFLVRSLLCDKYASASVIKDGAVYSSYKWSLKNDRGFLTTPRMIMLSLYHALQNIKPIHAPWGGLTGIRPTKLARQWIEFGLSDDEIVETYKNPYCVSEEKAVLALEVAKAENELKKIINISDKAVSLYINIPFCATRCLYCSFSTMDKPPSQEFQEAYVKTLLNEIAEKINKIKANGQVVSSIYIGGGTPTFVKDDLLEKILCSLNELKSNFLFEFTVEGGRPDSVTKKKLVMLKNYGVTRFCVNPQTLNKSTLQKIGRNHGVDEFYEAFQIVRDAGIKTISTDVVVGLPGETLFDVKNTMEGILKLKPENITVHNLAVKRASKLKLGLQEAGLPDGTAVQKQISTAQEYVKSAGYKPYYLYRQKDMVGLCENVGYSLDGFWCLYNVGMMSEVQTVIGAGAGAVSKFVEGSKITRKFNVKNPEVYINNYGLNATLL